MFAAIAKSRLATVTFLLYFALGAVTPVLGLYLTDRLHFTGRQSGLIMSASAVSALVSPLVCSFLADRVISAERLFSLLLLAGGALMAVLYKVTAFWPFLVLYLLYTVTVGATGSLSNAIIFHHVADRREYGRIRVWGTLGWIAVALAFGWLWLRGSGGRAIPERLPDALMLAALAMGALGLYALTLPASVELKRGTKPEFFPRSAFAVMRRPEALWLAFLVLAANVTDRTYYYAAAIFLKQGGISEANVMPMLSIGQILEVLAMLYLGRVTTRLGLVPVMLLGALFNVARYAFFLFGGGGPAMLTLGILMHGAAYTFFFSTAFILLDGMTQRENRAGVHQLFTVVYGGVGGILGSWIAGALLDYCRLDKNTVCFHAFWLMPFGIAVAVSLMLLARLAFRASAVPPPPADAPSGPLPDDP